MIRIVVMAAILFVAAPVSAQNETEAAISAQQAAMKRFEWMKGRWRGPATALSDTGEHRITQTERIGPHLDGTLMVMEGTGFLSDGSVGFRAFAVLSFDPRTGDYSLRSYAHGHSGTFKLVPTETGYIWEVPTGAGTVRYTATLSGGIWNEVGDRLVSGQAPQRFFEMNLTRVGDTDWPAAGAESP